MPSFTTNDGATLEYRDSCGDGFPLVLVHGWGQTQALFKHQLTGLAANHRVISYDQRGHGLSDKPASGYRIARLAKDLDQLLDHLNITQTDVLGWSMGVSVLWSYMDSQGCGRFRKFVAVDQPAAVAAVPWLTVDEQVECGALFGVDGLLELGAELNGPNGEVACQNFVRSMFSGEPAPEIWDFVSQEIRSSPAYASVPLLFDHCAQDWRDVLPRIDLPTLVLGCDGSHVNPESQRYIADRIPNAKIHIFTRAEANSHFPFLENPDAFNEIVSAFLE